MGDHIETIRSTSSYYCAALRWLSKNQTKKAIDDNPEPMSSLIDNPAYSALLMYNDFGFSKPFSVFCPSVLHAHHLCTHKSRHRVIDNIAKVSLMVEFKAMEIF